MRLRNRRQVISGAGAAALLLLLGDVLPLSRALLRAATPYRGVTYLTPAYEAVRHAIFGFVHQLEHSRPALPLEFFDSATLLKADEQLAALKKGQIDFMFHTTSYISQDLPILGITSLPGIGAHLHEHGERLAMQSDLWVLINEVLAADNLFMLTAGGGVMEPAYVWSSSRNPIVRLSDFKGKRCRSVGNEDAAVLAAFGSEAVRLPSAQTYLALQRGLVDGVVANISTIVARSLYEQLDYCFQVPVSSFSVAVFFLKDRWEKMAGTDRNSFWKAGTWYDRNQAKNLKETYYPRDYWPIIEKNGIEVVQPAEAELRSFGKQAEIIWSRWQARVGEDVGQRAIELALGLT